MVRERVQGSLRGVQKLAGKRIRWRVLNLTIKTPEAFGLGGFGAGHCKDIDLQRLICADPTYLLNMIPSASRKLSRKSAGTQARQQKHDMLEMRRGVCFGSSSLFSRKESS